MPRSTPNQIEIQRMAGHTLFQRGLSLYRSGAVQGVIQRGELIQAEVQGSDADPYVVTLRFRGERIHSMECSCPYEYGPICKHIVAVLLLLDDDPATVEERPPLSATLDELDGDQLRALLLDVAAQHPDIADLVESHVRRLGAPPANQSPAAQAANIPIDRQIQHILYDQDRLIGEDWGYQDIETADARAQQVRAALQAGDGRGAIKLLEIMTRDIVESVINGYDEYDDYDAGFDAYDGLDELWAEALLSPDVTNSIRSRWAKKLADWDNELEEYGFETLFAIPVTAAEEGWNAPWLTDLLASGAPDRIDSLDLSSLTEDVVGIRLNLLARAGRDKDYLILAEAFGKHERYAEMLLRQGRRDEAVAYGLAHFTKPYQALHLALALAQGSPDPLANAAARRIAAHGLGLDAGDAWDGMAAGERLALARQLRDWAEAAGDRDQALDAALTLLALCPTLEDYRKANALAGDAWDGYRDQALAAVRAATDLGLDHEQAAIFLHEGRIDEAIDLADQPRASIDAIALVVSAAVAERPAWARDRALRQASQIIEAAKASRYEEAAFWLEHVRGACVAAGQQQEWHWLLDELITRHKRKYKLVPILERLREKKS